LFELLTQFSPPANIITLDRNYRSTQTILGAANGVIGLASERFTKNLWTDRAPGTRPQLVTPSAVSSLGGLRTPAPASAAPPSWGRHPQTFTISDMH
jgi:hypothetical protein